MNLLKVLLGIGLFFSFASANAVVFKRCDNCTSPVGAARSVATETRVIVVDTPQNKLYAYDVWWDFESSRWIAYSVAVPAELPPLLTRMKAMADGGGTATIYYDNRQVSTTIKFPAGYSQTTSYDLLANATLRSQFLTVMANQILGANTSLVQQFASYFYSILGEYGLSGQNVVIHFADGSQIIVRLDKSNVTKATLISAEDKYGNPMALPGLTNGGLTTGSYNFYYDTLVRDQWVYTASLVGVTFTGLEGNAVVCVIGTNGQMTCNQQKD